MQIDLEICILLLWWLFGKTKKKLPRSQRKAGVAEERAGRGEKIDARAMKASVEKLRWVLGAGALLLLVVVVAFLGYGRYKQAMKWAAMVKRLNLHGPHETRGFTYTSSPKDKTAYKIHADRVVQHGDGTWSLYDVDMTLYSKTSTDEDHIKASDIEYDQNTGVAKAIGEVHMDFEASAALKGGKGAAARSAPAKSAPAKSAEGEEANVIHVKTSGLVYVKKLDVAATDQPVEFRYSGLQCTALGAEFHSGDSELRLLADVVLTGTVKNEPITVHAEKADLDRTANTVTMERPVGESRGRTARAAHAVIHLRKDGSMERADADGGVTLDEGTRHVVAAVYAETFGTESQPLTAKLNGGVTLVDANAMRPMHGKAATADMSFTSAGQLQEMIASGGAQMVEVVKAAGQPDLPREVRGDRIVTEYASVPGVGMKRKAQVREIRVNGSAYASGVSVADKKGAAGGLKSTEMSADELRAAVTPDANGKLQVQKVNGSGHTKVVQRAPAGALQVSTGDELVASFAPGRDGEMQVAHATQTGQVTLHSLAAAKAGAAAPEPADATAVRANYDGGSATFALDGGVHFQQGAFDLTAATMGVNQLTGDAEAGGGVMATMVPATKDAAGVALVTKPGEAPRQPTHVTADHATMLHASQLAEFFGTSARPARLWQGASEVQAATVLFDQKKKSIAARPESGGKVHAVFAREAVAGDAKSLAGVKAPGGAKVAQSVVRVSSSTMDYDDEHREGTFGGGVRMDGTTMQAVSQRAVVFLEPEVAKSGDAKVDAAKSDARGQEFGGRLRRVVMMENVQLSQPGRTGTGDMLVYNAADANYTLTGTPGKLPHVVDRKQGSVTGPTLVFHDEGTGDVADSTIIVSGLDKAGKQGRVREEVEVKGK